MDNAAKASSNSFEWIEDTYQFNEYFIKNYIKESDKYKVFNMKNYMNFIMICHFYLGGWRL